MPFYSISSTNMFGQQILLEERKFLTKSKSTILPLVEFCKIPDIYKQESSPLIVFKIQI